MEKGKNVALWIEQGYSLFSEEGLEGIQVERLSRILQLNKSGFYHYFGDMEGYCVELLRLHDRKVALFIQEIQRLKKVDPDYLLLLVKYAPTVMFQVQLTRNKEDYSFYKASEAVDRRINLALQNLWGDFISVDNVDLAMRYYHIVRDMFYTRISFQNLNYPFLRDFATEAKELIDQVLHHRSHLETAKSHP